MALAVETHPQREQILNWIGDGLDCSAIARKLQPPIDPTTIWRYKRRRLQTLVEGNAAVVKGLAEKGLLREDVKPEQAMQVVQSASVAQHLAEPILSRIFKHQQTIDSSLEDATKAKSGREVAALIGTDFKGLELTARLTGLLDSPNSSSVTNNWYVAMVTPPAPAGPAPTVIDVAPTGSVSDPKPVTPLEP